MAELNNFNGRCCEFEFEFAFIALLENEGWAYTHGNNIPRQNKNDVLIQKDFQSFIASTNSDLTEIEVEQIYDIVRLVGAKTDFATLHKVWHVPYPVGKNPPGG